MRYLNLVALLSFLIPFSGFAADTPREIVLETKLVNNATHWSPEKIEVTQGEKIHLVAKHELKGGFDYHGLFIPALKVTEQVNRGKKFEKDITIANDMKPGEYKVSCQFHSTHQPATLVVKAK